MLIDAEPRALDSVEFHLLAGTDFLVQMIRNRICVDSSRVSYNDILEYLDSHCESNFYIRRDGYKLFVYFEQVRDRDGLVQFLGQYSDVDV